jgi:hypothetical protein
MKSFACSVIARPKSSVVAASPIEMRENAVEVIFGSNLSKNDLKGSGEKLSVARGFSS